MKNKNREYRAVRGLQEVYFIEQVKDSQNEVEYNIAEGIHLTNPVNFSMEMESSSEPEYAGDRVIEIAQARGTGSYSVELHDLQEDLELMITGATKDENGIIRYNKDDESPYVAVIVKVTKGGGDYYLGLPKVMFSLPSEGAATSEATAGRQTVTIEGQATSREFDGETKFKVSEKEENFDLETFINLVALTETKEETP